MFGLTTPFTDSTGVGTKTILLYYLSADFATRLDPKYWDRSCGFLPRVK